MSRPFLKVMAVPLALLLVARLTLGPLLTKRIDPTLELLFGDDVMDLYVACFFGVVVFSLFVPFFFVLCTVNRRRAVVPASLPCFSRP